MNIPDHLKPVAESFKRQKFANLIGAKLSDLADDYCEITLDAREDLLRPSGIFNGGVIGALADAAAGYAAATHKNGNIYLVTVEFKVNFLSPAKGEKLVARSKVIKFGKTLVVTDCNIYTVTDKKEKLCAVALVTLYQLKQK
jgi:uncharacterized protein (TIGR00369 family)